MKRYTIQVTNTVPGEDRSCSGLVIATPHTTVWDSWTESFRTRRSMGKRVPQLLAAGFVIQDVTR